MSAGRITFEMGIILIFSYTTGLYICILDILDNGTANDGVAVNVIS